VNGEPDRFGELEEELIETFSRGCQTPIPEEEFNDLALRIFRFQCRAVAPYGVFSVRRGVEPEQVERWEDIPPLPARAFKSAYLAAGEPEEMEAVFRTSGTTGGNGERGRHPVRSLDLYRASLLPNFQTHLLPDREELLLVALLPDPREVPDSSLSFMMGEVRDRLCGGRGEFHWDPLSGIRLKGLLEALKGAEESGEPVLVAGTAFAFVHWIEAARMERWRVRLPEGSRIMETGGFKGRSRTIPREELYGGLQETLAVPVGFIVNEYGMTELLSQFYEPVLADFGEGGSDRTRPGAGDAVESRYHRGPPWVRTRVLHPLTLDPVGPGEVGVLCHLDLANLGSVSSVLTEDLGRSIPGGFRLQGRSPGAEPRGCSLAMEEFLSTLEGDGDGL
jgi:hypothetical protein